MLFVGCLMESPTNTSLCDYLAMRSFKQGINQVMRLEYVSVFVTTQLHPSNAKIFSKGRKLESVATES